MIVGVGTDIIEIERIKRAILNTKNFVSKAFSDNEIALFESKGYRAEVIAGNFAAKEAISKALGTGIRGFRLKDIEILRDNLGSPVAFLKGKAINIAESKGVVNIHITISHDRSNAIAFAVLEGE